MRRNMWIAAFLSLITVLVFPVSCRAAEAKDVFPTESVKDALPEAGRSILGDPEPGQITDTQPLLERLGEALQKALRDALGPAFRAGLGMVLIAFLVSLVSLFGEKGTRHVVTAAGAAALLLSAGSPLNTFLTRGQETLTELSGFSAAVLPVMASAAAASGAAGSAPVKYAAASLFLSGLQTVSQRLLLPLIRAYVGLSAGAAALGSTALKKTAGLIKRLAGLGLTVTVLSFVLYLSLTGLVSGSADAALTRVLKTAVSTALPVVGGIVSDAAASVAAGLGVLRGSLGTFGILAVCAVCVGPFAGLAAYWLVFRLCEAIAGCFEEGPLCGLIGAVADAFGMLLGLSGSFGVMLFLSLYSLMKTVSFG